MPSQLVDTFGRVHNNLRISVTDRCNLRCSYCMDENVTFMDRSELLTFVVAGGGFSGVEVCAELNDFVRKVAKERRIANLNELRVVLLHSGERILEREVTASLGTYAEKILRRRGIELRLKSRLGTASPAAAVLATGERIPCRTLVSTVPSRDRSAEPDFDRRPVLRGASIPHLDGAR